MAIPPKLACPHCYQTKVNCTPFTLDDTTMWQAYCNECRMAAPCADSPEHAILAWNKMVQRLAPSTVHFPQPGGTPIEIHLYFEHCV